MILKDKSDGKEGAEQSGGREKKFPLSKKGQSAMSTRIFLSNFESKIPYVVWSDKETADLIPADFQPILRERNDRIRRVPNFVRERGENFDKTGKKSFCGFCGFEKNFFFDFFVLIVGSEKEQKIATN